MWVIYPREFRREFRRVLASRYALAGLRGETPSEKNSLRSVLIHVDNKVNAIALNLDMFWHALRLCGPPG